MKRDYSLPRHRHEMHLRVGGNDVGQLANRLRQIADDIEIDDRDEPRSVSSSDGYTFTIAHDPEMTASRYRSELDAWMKARR